jgi:hypothetical protein
VREIRPLGLMRRGLETACPEGTAPILDPTRECKSLTGKETRTILTSSFAGNAARYSSKRRQRHRQAG